jgi:hypothetical protein
MCLAGISCLILLPNFLTLAGASEISSILNSDPIAVGKGQFGVGRRSEETMVVEENVGSYKGASEVVANSNDIAPKDTSNAGAREDGDAEDLVISNAKGTCPTRR